MVTGDQQLIGIETARQLGMGTDIHKIEVLLQVRFVAALMSGQCWPQDCLRLCVFKPGVRCMHQKTECMHGGAKCMGSPWRAPIIFCGNNHSL
jgi:hypothetical protein